MTRETALVTLGSLSAATLAGLPLGAKAEPNPNVTLHIWGPQHKIMGPDGMAHVAFVPSEFEVPVNTLVRVTVINEDPEKHSMTAPGLALDAIVKPAREAGGKIVPVSTTFTFTPYASGVYRWYCRFPCDMGSGMWAMGTGYTGRGKEGFMAGRIIVV
jgi:plastocyanin